MRLALTHTLVLLLLIPFGVWGLNSVYEPIRYDPIIPSLTGPAISCEGATGVVYSTDPEKTDYLWVVSSGGTITSGQTLNSIMVTWNTAGPQTVSVSYFNSSVTTLDVEVMNSFPVSVSIAASANPVCNGVSVTYTATPVNGGGTPEYIWMVNNVGVGTNSSVFSFVPANGNEITCRLTSNLQCVTGNPATSEPIVMSVVQNLPVSLNITASANPACEGSAVVFTAHPLNGGTSPVFQWKVNGNNAGTGGMTFSYQPGQGDLVTCVMTSNATCPSGSPATSNTISMIVSQNLPVSVAITASSNPSCVGNLVSFTALATNGGLFPVYNWFVNGTPIGMNNPVYSYTPVSGDVVNCILTSSAGCVTGSPANSNDITMAVAPYAPVSVSIAVSANPSCNGVPVTFTATGVNGGTSPDFQWFVNDATVGPNSSVFTYTPSQGDVVKCQLTSNALCNTGNPATSNLINMTVSSTGATSISIAASGNPICQGTLVTFTATTNNGGTSPVYQWFVNGNSVGANSPAYAYIPVNGDNVTCSFTSNSLCSSGNPVISNTILMAVSTVLAVSVSITTPNTTICQGSPATFIAAITNGGTAPVLQWQVNGGNVGLNTSAYTYTPADNDVITCILTSSASCATGSPAISNPITMNVSASLPAEVSIEVSANPACVGIPVEFTATPINGGTAPTYEWRVNNIPALPSLSPTFSYSSNNDYSLHCIMTSNNGCPAVNSALSNVISMVVNPLLPVTVSVTPSSNPSCLGAFITYTAIPLNGGTLPVFQWKVNGVNVGTNMPTYTYAPVSGDVIVCQLTSNIPCAANSVAVSNIVTMTVNTIATASIIVTTPEDTVCPGTQVIFTAITTNGGTSPVYQWFVNGTPRGTNSNVLSWIPNDGDKITCRLTSSLPCVTGNPVMSVEFTIHTNSPLPGSINISASSNPFCQGSSVTFSSTMHNGGLSPGYTWKVNGLIPVGATNSTYIYQPVNGDFVTCVLSSSLTCSTGPVTSNPILMVVKTTVPASIIISASVNPVCQDNPVTFTAVPVNGGSVPVYQWQVNGFDIAGATNINYTFIPANGNIVTCKLTSNAPCVSGSPAISLPVIMTVSSGMPVNVFITTPTNPFCQGSVVSFVANPVNGGTAPVYQWKVNGADLGSGPLFSYMPANNDQVTCALTSNSSCISGSSQFLSNSIVMAEVTSLPVSIVITASSNPSCQGSPVTFTATSTNGGTSPVYQWKVDGANVNGATNVSYTFVPVHGKTVTCVLLSDLACATGNPATSNTISMSVSSTIFPTVSISPSLNPVCTGTLVNFTALPVNGGSSPTYIWRVNGVIASGATNSTYAYIPSNYDAVTCQITSNIACNSGIPVLSNQIAMVVKAELPVSVNITTQSLTFCAGTSVTFTATPVNGGTSPTYQWWVNTTLQTGATNSNYTYSPISGDAVKCVLTSNQTCINNNPATSNTLVVTAGTGFPVSVTISAGSNPICQGTTVLFTAVPLYGGTPQYQWKVNGVNQGTGLFMFQYQPVNNDVVTCELTSSLTGCVINNPAMSNAITMIVNESSPVSVVVTAASNPSCLGSNVCFFASVTNGGTFPRYRWKVNGTVVSSMINNPTHCFIPVAGDVVSCQVVSDATCPTPNPCPSNNITMEVLPMSLAGVTISASANPVCEGSVVSFTSNPVNGGTAPLYEWKVNGINAPGATNAVYSYSPANSDVVTNQMTSNAFCVLSNVVNSNPVPMVVSPYSPVSVTIIASVNPVCQGQPVTFIASPQHGGSAPVYQWMVNGIISGTNSSQFTYLPSDGETVTCQLTSNDACTMGSPAMSNAVTVTVIPALPVSVSIVASEMPECQGATIIYTATALNGGANPLYQWLINGMIVGTNSPTYSYVPSSGDVVACYLTSDIVCATGNPALSNSISMTFPPYLPVSVFITCSANPACQGIPVTFNANHINGGLSPVYHWKVNNQEDGGNQPFFTYTPANGDVVTCMLEADIPCPLNPEVTSNSITMSVLVPTAASLSITPSGNHVCVGTSVTFTATSLNAGSSPEYQWLKNGLNAGTNSPLYTYTPANGDLISCVLTSSMTCVTNNPVMSETIEMIVGSDFPASITIAASANPACSGQQVTFTANPVNGGDIPSFQWFVNEINVGQNNPVYVHSPTSGDVVRCQLTSSYTCATGSPASSNQIVMAVNSIVPASISIDCSGNPACVGIPITFTANAVNAGTSPSYQWQLNGGNTGLNSPILNYVPADGDAVSCVLTSSELCVSGNPAQSNTIDMIIGTSWTPNVNIIASGNPICQFTYVDFTATSTFGGPSPSYQWYVNGLPVGTNSTVYSYFPVAEDEVICVMTSQLTCATTNPTPSNTISMTVLEIPVAITITADITVPVCDGTIITFTGHPVNGGGNPTFQWKVNDQPLGTNNISFAYAPQNGDEVTCTLMSNATCSSGNTVTSLPIYTVVNPNLPVTITISPDAGNTVCAETMVAFTAATTNEGLVPLFQWYVNNVPVGLNSAAFSYVPLHNDIIYCMLTSDVTCVAGSPATSNEISMTVNPNLPVSVSIAASVNPVCEGVSVTFTATSTNGGNTPSYQWRVNGVDIGTDNPVFAYLPADNDLVTCELSSDAVCATGSPAISGAIAMTVNPNLPVSVSISASANPVCDGTPVIFTAVPANGGTIPSFLWKVNGLNAGTDDPVLTFVPVGNEVVTCELSSNEMCAVGSPAISGSVTMTVNPNLPVSISVMASANPVCAGTTVTFTASSVNGGTDPSYQWKVNGLNTGTDDPVFTLVPTGNELVTCELTSNVTCGMGNPAISGEVAMIVNPNLPVSISISPSANPVCEGTSVTFNAIAINGGPGPSYLWKVNGIIAGAEDPVYTFIPVGNELVTCELSSNATCSTGSPATSGAVTVLVNPNLPVSVSITPSANPVCSGTTVVFTATPVNGGNLPAYQWKVDGINSGTNDPVFAFVPVGNEIIHCELNSNATCAMGSPAVSGSVNMVVNPNLPVSISITPTANPVCEGTQVVYTATSVNEGTIPSYQWKVNGINSGNDNPVFAYIPLNNETITCELTSNATCATGNPATSGSVSMTVNPNLPVSISVTASSNTVCEGTQVMFTAFPVNGGTSPSYQWKVNGANAGPDDPVFTFVPAGNEIISCELISNATCATGSPANSGEITMTVNPNLPVSISIAASDNPVCEGAPVILTATPINGGTVPSFQWKVDGVNAGIDDPGFSFFPSGNEVVTCELISNALCATGSPAVSGSVTVIVNPILPVSLSITASENPVCAGTPVVFTAMTINGGTIPSYQWEVNGLISGNDDPVFTFIPTGNEIVRCVLTSNAACPSGNPAVSGPVTMTVNPVFPVIISIEANPPGSVCSGIPVTFTATIGNGGSAPQYQWRVNGVAAGTNSDIFTYPPVLNDIVTCVLTSDLTCTSNNPATSAPYLTLIDVTPVVTYNCSQDIVTAANAEPFKLRGGIPLGGVYSGSGVTLQGGFYIFNPGTAAIGDNTITYTYTTSGLCTASSTFTINNHNTTLVNCGEPVIDFRDNDKSYPTVLIGSQCWMAKNLDLGTMKYSSVHQVDNCMVEKYCLNDVDANCSLFGGLYQWDELMKHDPVAGAQGLCPAGWHIPTNDEWLTLINNYLRQSEAGTALKDPAIGSFQALLGGVFYQDQAWAFYPPGFSATFFWTSETDGSGKAMTHGMNSLVPSVSNYSSDRSNGFSVRCLKNSQ